MPENAKNVDALLATACSRLLNSAAIISHMRVLHGHGSDSDYWCQNEVLAEHLIVAGRPITEAHGILLAKQGIVLQMPGGLPN